MNSRPQVKICGLTYAEEAVACVELGAAAIGCVFYPPSPRCVGEGQARDLGEALPAYVWTVGVFVNEGFSAIMEKVERCGLRAVQLHGQEPPTLTARLLREGVPVFKALFVNRAPDLATAESYRVNAYLVEAAGGRLPGGNALVWDWAAAKDFAEKFPTILAGGLAPENVAEAIEQACPDAVDVSSGVEAEPGRKDLDKVKRFMEAVAASRTGRTLRTVFS